MGVASKPTMGRRTVLIVLDQSVVSGLMQAALGRNDYRILLTQTRAKALQLASKQPALDVVVVDLDLGTDALRLADELRPSFPGLKTLFVSFESRELQRAKGIDIPPQGFLQKPFRFEELFIALDRMLQPLPTD